MRWLRYAHAGREGLGFLEPDGVHACRGELFGKHEPTGEIVPESAIRYLTPCQPSKLIALYNNLRAAVEQSGFATPAEPLFFIKTPSCYCAHGDSIRVPKSYEGDVLFEGELGVVIGKAGRDIPLADAASYVFGYTCVNDVTAAGLFGSDPSFTHWTRAKSLDTFGPFGPVIATELDPTTLTVRTFAGGRERQNYPVADMVFSPLQLVSLISRDLTLVPGDIISCGTSTGVGALHPGTIVQVVIDGIGTLENGYQ